MADGSIIFETKLDNKMLERDLQAAKKKIANIENSIYKNEQKKLPLIQQSKELAAALDEAKAKLFEMQNAPKGTFDTSAISDQRAYVSGLQSEYNRVENRIDSNNRKIDDSNIDLDLEKTRAGQIAQELAKAANEADRMGKNTEKSSKAMSEMEKRTRRFGSRMREIVSGALFFNLISSGIRGMVNWMGTMISTNDEARASIAQLKGALLTLAQPILNVVIPAFVSLVNILTRVIAAIASVVSRLFGTTAQKSAEAAKALNKQADAYGGAGKAAKEAAKSIMGFDELNTLQADTDAGDTGGGGGGIGDSITPDFSGFDSDLITKEIEELTVYLSGALLALGAVLTFSGANIPLGIGLMAAGALGLASVIVPNWNDMDEEIKGAVDTVLLSLAGAGLVIGAILAFSGVNIPLGIGLMAVGALSLAAEAALNWDSISPHIEEALAVIEMILGAAVLGIGAVLAFTGVNIPLGIAMIAAGAVGLARSQTVDWNSMATALKGPLGTITAIASGFLLALGLVLAFSGVGLPLGIGLIFAGCAGLVTTAAVNWDSIVEKLKEVWGNITSWFNSNVAPKLTLGYWNQKLDAIKQGFSNLWTSVRDTAANIWDGIVGTIKGAINGIISAINGMISGMVNGINLVGQTLNSLSFQIPSWVPGFGGATFGFNIPQITAPQIPYLAQGAVIPPNREFLAVLGDQSHGTNIEAPLSTIEEAVIRATASNEQLQVLREQNDLLRQILAKTGFYLDGKETAEWLAPYQRNMERARGW